ncbi:MAG: PH domain-containing protein [Flavobacteriaceae bacterium]
MNNSFDFSEYTRQSAKGIIIIYFKNVYAFIKKSWVFIPMLVIGKTSPDKIQKMIWGLIIILLFLLIKSILDYFYFKFKIVDNHFVLKEGVLNKKQLSIPFERIQNINFKQNFIQQLINVTQVEVETAGAKKTEISIKAIEREKAEAIKSQIFGTNTINEDAIAKKDVNKPILQISLTELVKISITENHLKSFGIFVGFLFMIYSQIKDAFKDFTLKDTVGVDIEQQAPNTLIGFGIIVIIAFIIGLIISFVRVFLIHFDLAVYIKNKTLEITQGLLTKRHHILKKEKVQYITITTNPLKQILGISGVNFKQANSAKAKVLKLIRIVGCENKHLDNVKNMLYNEHTLANKTSFKPHKYYIFQMFFRSFIVIALLNVVVLLPMIYDPETPKDFNLFYWNFLLIPIVIFLILLKYKKTYFKFNDELLIKGFGQIGTKTTYFEYFKIQSIKTKQTIFQKRKGIKDLFLVTAVGKIKLPCIKNKQANQLYNYFLYQTEISTKEWM